ncbi:hypothetical protein ABT040_27710 [Streptomyces sp. NPDC002688]|uniref:hypothetical protein n=1 Tax=Streptomyces sp. NPDC002688 TaxID=3154423 RepID=UPI00331B39C4
MNQKMRSRVGTFLATSALVVGTSLTLGATDAAAADFTFSKSGVSADGSFDVKVYYGGDHAGTMQWNGDPSGSEPGDAFRVKDVLADGFGIEARMIDPTTGRYATTRGEPSPYTSGWNTGNLDEGTEVFIQVCAIKGTGAWCSIAYQGHA